MSREIDTLDTCTGTTNTFGSYYRN